jgi:hypothetical protein
MSPLLLPVVMNRKTLRMVGKMRTRKKKRLRMK